MSDSAFTIASAVVAKTARLSPTFVRITFTGPALSGFGNPGRVLDQRIKLIFPPDGGRLPTLVGDEDWYSEWLALPEAERGSMRTYSIRDLRVADTGETAVDIDFVLHLEPGSSGPASRWASRATAGDQLLLVGPRRGHLNGGGIEYLPGGAERIVLAGDETAAPAIARILEESAGSGRQVTAFIEVPHEDDLLEVGVGSAHGLRWLPRGSASSGEVLIPEVVRYLGLETGGALAAPEEATADGSAPWETPTYTNLSTLGGGSVEQGGAASATSDSTYFWIAGESKLVTTLRRHLVGELGIDRSRVAFMGYWRRGVAMRG